MQAAAAATRHLQSMPEHADPRDIGHGVDIAIQGKLTANAVEEGHRREHVGVVRGRKRTLLEGR
jgi:hypothetical protein